jgi:hypothetical protein
MAILTDQYQTFDAKGIREDLSDVISNISPEDTPVYSMAGKERCKNTLFEWQTDALAAAAANKQLEGDDITTFAATTATTRVGNYTQISRKLMVLSGTLEAVDKAGRRSELSYQMAKKGAELKRDIEYTILSNVAGTAGSASAARATATLGAWVKTNTVNLTGSGGADPDYTSGVPNKVRSDDTGTLQTFTEALMASTISLMWASGAKPKYLFVGPVNKVRFAAFAGVATKTFNATAKAPIGIIGAADVYVSNFGTLTCMADRFQRERDAWYLDFDFVSVATLRPFQTIELAKTGDAEKRMLLTEWGLKIHNEAALGLTADLDTDV